MFDGGDHSNVYHKVWFLNNLGSVLARFHYMCVPLYAFIVSNCMLCCQPACTKRGTLKSMPCMWYYSIFPTSYLTEGKYCLVSAWLVHSRLLLYCRGLTRRHILNSEVLYSAVCFYLHSNMNVTFIHLNYEFVLDIVHVLIYVCSYQCV